MMGERLLKYPRKGNKKENDQRDDEYSLLRTHITSLKAPGVE
jgi:hypothetical protein